MVPWLNARLRRSHGARAVSVLASRSRDGSLMGDYARRFGLDVIRGSSSRGGAEALRALKTAVDEGRDVALAPDGPRGPRGQLGSGVVALAALTGGPSCRSDSPRGRRGIVELGCVPDSGAVRTRGARIRGDDVDRPRRRSRAGPQESSEASTRRRPRPTGW
jgi:hypothetical protein